MEESLVAYFLGELSEQEQTRLESEYLGDKEKFKLLKATRDDLIDAYVDGNLSEKQRKQFQKLLLKFPGLRQNVAFAEVLIEYISRQGGANASATISIPKKDTSIWESITAFFRARNFALQISLATIALIVLSGSIWLTFELSRLKSQLRKLEVRNKKPSQLTSELRQQITVTQERTSQLSKELGDERSKRTELEERLTRKQDTETEPLLNSLAFILLPDVVRSEEDYKRLIIPSSLPIVGIQLGLNKKLSSDIFQARLSNGNGDQVWGKNGLKIQKRNSNSFILLKLPTKILTNGYYTIDLRTATPSGNYETVFAYTFKILRK